MDGHAVESGPNGGESCKMLYYREIQETYSVKGKSSSESNKMSYGKTCGFGGFGGGGGGCSAGGGGGGYSGGDAYDRIDANGQGGFSYLDPQGEYSQVSTGVKGNAGPGELIIIPAVKGCGCSFLCVALDEYLQDTACICQPDLILDDNNKTCIAPPSPASLLMRDIGEYCIMALCFIGFLISSFVILRWAYEIFKHRKLLENRSKVANGFANSDIQLNHLRSGNLLSNVLRDNPTYEFSSQAHEMLHGLRTDLVQIPRENLQLVKALGQGAFGEVYQGLYRQRTGDTVEMPVAVKTLPQVSTSQNEADFLMEACIMQNFKHPNIVRLLGVCFDQHPRYIVIELLAGGDLKNFLRESRPKPERPSPLTVKDLLLSAIDVAKGCKYLEDRRFVHRDIAARNCLLTTKGPGRTVKIADFGMARDIYRNDYYKKGGKAMLPIKWMPPEAFLDGIFSAMTDVWSYGVLLWEIMSLGYMPYTGCANKEVMQLVKGGGRLEPPSNCPLPIYAIMTSCWNPDPEKRPNFGMLLERMDYCLQDPDVVNASLPVFAKPPSVERDQTVMRPNTSEECLNMDYLIPLGPVLKREEKDNSNNTGSCSPTSVATVLDNIPPPLEGNTNDDDCDINDIVDFTNIPPPKEYIDWSPQQAQDLVPTTIITNGLYNDTDDDTEEEEEEDDEEEEEEEEEDETSTLSECRQWNRNPTYPHIKINGDIHDEDTTSVSDLNSPSSSDATASTSTANQNNSNQSSICGNKKPMPSVKFNTKNANGKNGDNEKRPPFTLSGTFVPDTEISC
ncbi:ALK tyrosine kinase receptor isoform X1 [Diaphorina citri]|uniref:ALK tyrosine kinase receptor isoform X1 n=1 Tax=Diaphorina citri TaxID=121845 RepID=A0A3Q0ISX8_DIACI|nr:ALK tyrosine kinase receptor isoform X1 [Diaphorina citri]